MGYWADMALARKNILIKYLGGHPEIERAQLLGLRSEGDTICLCLAAKVLVRINKADVLGIKLDRASTRSAGKAAAGAIIGGALTGGVGLLAGAAIGGRKKDDSIILLTINYGVAELEIMFEGKEKYSRIVGLLK